MSKARWRKSPPELIEQFGSVLPGPPAESRKMFGYPAAFVNGHMFMSLHQESFIVRLPEKERKKLIDKGGQHFEPMAGRPMREYITVPESILSNPRELRRWVNKALEHASSLPPKEKKNKAPARRVKQS